MTCVVCFVLLVGMCFPGDKVQTSPQAQPAATLKIAPGSLTFAPESMDTASAPQIISLTNNGNSELQITDILTSGIDFSQTNTCGEKLEGGATCAVSVTFKPATLGPRLGTISITTSDLSGLHLVAVNGTGR